MMRLLTVLVGMGLASTLGFAGPSYADDHLFQATNAEDTAAAGGIANAKEHRPLEAPRASTTGFAAPGQGSPFSGEEQEKPSVGVDELNPKAQENVPFGEE